VRRHWRMILIAVILVMVGAWTCLRFLLLALGVGSFPLAVSLKSPRPIKAVSYWLLPDGELARMVLAHPPDTEDVDYRPADRKKDSSFVLFVTLTNSWDGFGIEHSYSFPRFTVLQIEFRDGGKIRHLFEVPPGRSPREIEVELP
jgi:hypothetical protein